MESKSAGKLFNNLAHTLRIAADTGLAPKACGRMSGKPDPQGNAHIHISHILTHLLS